MTSLYNRSSIKTLMAPAGALLWLFLSGLYYFRNWNPLDPHPASLVVRQSPRFLNDLQSAALALFSLGLPELTGLCFVFFAAIGCGAFFLTLIRATTPEDRLLIPAAGVGTGLLSCYTFILGSLGLYNRTGKNMTLALLAALALYGIFLTVTSVGKHLPTAKNRYPDLFFWALLSCVTCFLCAKALKPAVFYDAVTYHLGVPNYYLLEGGIRYIPYDAFSNFPFLAEMLYTLGFLVSGLKLAQMTSVMIFFLLALSLYDFCRRFLKKTNPVIAPMLFCATPAFMETAVLYTNDLHLAFYLFMLGYAYFLYEQEKKPGVLILMGCYAGFCLATKYTAVVSVGIITVYGYQTLSKNFFNLKPLRQAYLFLLPALILFAPWLVKNILFTGNPVYPAFYGFFGGQDMSAEMYQTINRFSHPSHISGIFSGLFTHPFALLFPAAWQESPYGTGWNFGPGLAGFVPLIFFCRKIPSRIQKTAFAALLLFITWNCTFLMARFLFPAIIFLLIVSAGALSSLIRAFPSWTAGFIRTVFILYTFTGLAMGFYTVNNWTGSLGPGFIREPDDRYLLRQMIDNEQALLYSLPVYTYINKNLKPEAKILVIGDAQHLYLRRRHVYTYLSATTPYDIFRNQKGKPFEIAEVLAARGITHIVYHPSEMKRLQACGAIGYQREDNGAIAAFLAGPAVKKLMEYRYRTVTVTLFEIN